MQALESDDPPQLGGYRLLARLGAGGMGRVYLARSRGGRRVALKVIRPELADDPDFRARFAREVASARAVGGAFTVAVLDADPQAATPWLATEYVPGPSLSTAVREHGPLPLESVRALAAGLAEALAAIHAAGVVHRDLKPSNVLLAADGPRVIDFGISRAAEATELTRTGMVVGSPGFMSPEQIEGSAVTPATDVFSLGAVLAFAATGAGPFGEGATPALLYRVVHSEPRLEGVPEEVRGLIGACLAKEAAARPSPDGLLDRLEASEPADAGHDPTQTWLPAELTGMIARVEADLPSRLRSLGGNTDATGKRPASGPGAAAGAGAAGLAVGAAAGAAAEAEDHPGTERVTPASGTGGTGGGARGGPLGAGATPAAAATPGGASTPGGTAATVPQQPAGQPGSTPPATPPPGFGPAPSGFGPAPAGFAAEGRPTPPPAGRGPNVTGPGAAGAGTVGLGMAAAAGASGTTTEIGPAGAAGAAGRKRRWLIALAAAAALIATAVGVVIAETGGNTGNSGNDSTVSGGGQSSSSSSAYPSSSDSAGSSSSASASSGSSSTGSDGGSYVTVPSVLGQPVDYAKQQLENAGFGASAISVSYHCSSSGSGVYAQSPKAGSRSAADAQVTLSAYETDCVAYTDEVGKLLSTAQSDLGGFSHVGVEYTCVSGATAGYVVGQSPQPGSASAYPPGRQITLKVQQDGCGSSSSASSSASASASSSPAASATSSYSGSTSAQGGGGQVRVSGSAAPSATPTAS
ncbi:protein kinase [Streptacidiphilus sp. N1-10]|uniref:non-specific serine/threonine protein kinase n=1 Tax=Streptacidiphilus jeojiensis TaxID=3229225 RepID=A0ABV6XTX6_9ACTN